MGPLIKESKWKNLIPFLDHYRKWKEQRKAKKMIRFMRKAKDIFDMGLYGVETERVWITWGKNRIGFDKPLTAKIEDALMEIVKVGRMAENGELKEIDLAEEEKDMPQIGIDDLGNSEKRAEFHEAMEKWDNERLKKRAKRDMPGLAQKGKESIDGNV